MIWAQEQDGVTSDRPKQGMASDPDNVHASVVLCKAGGCDPCKQPPQKNCRHRVHLLSRACPPSPPPPPPLCVVHCHLYSLHSNNIKSGGVGGCRSRVRVVGVGGVEKGKVGGHELCD